MLNFIFYVLQIILFLVLLGTAILFILWAIGNFKNQVPFVTASSKVLKDIEKAFIINDSSVVYVLGCGDGRIMLHLSTAYPKARYIGIENSIFPVILARVGSYLNYKKTGNKVEIVKGDFFKQDLSNATCIFVYLYPTMMDELLPKFEKEFKPGTQLVSLSFQFKDKKPVREIDLGRSKFQLGRKIFVYQF
jgi:trans-aconitate methyltransferase